MEKFPAFSYFYSSIIAGIISSSPTHKIIGKSYQNNVVNSKTPNELDKEPKKQQQQQQLKKVLLGLKQAFVDILLTSIPPPQTRLEGFRAIVFVFMWIVWSSLTTFDQKMNALAASVIFASIEWSWTFCAYGKPRTTFEQFYIILLYWPFLHEPYLYYMKTFGSLLRFAFFPILVWVAEVIEGYTLMYFHNGLNPAWCYKCKDALFHGNIRLYFFPHWLALGLITEIIFLVLPVQIQQPIWSNLCT